jgi:hypothetical protein
MALVSLKLRGAEVSIRLGYLRQLWVEHGGESKVLFGRGDCIAAALDSSGALTAPPRAGRFALLPIRGATLPGPVSYPPKRMTVNLARACQGPRPTPAACSRLGRGAVGVLFLPAKSGFGTSEVRHRRSEPRMKPAT